MEPLTRKQAAVLEAIQRILEEEGAPPTLRELARRLGLDVKSVAQHLDRLERKGYLSRRRGRSRNIRLAAGGAVAHLSGAAPVGPSAKGSGSPVPAEARGLPLVGRIAAGSPVEAVEEVEDRLRLETFFGPEGTVFLLRVEGDSMEGAGIRRGDLVAVARDEPVPEGAPAVVVVEGETTVKRLFRKGRRLLLAPENPDYEPLLVDPARQAVRVVGPVKGLVRPKV